MHKQMYFLNSGDIITRCLLLAPVSHQDRFLLHQGLPRWELHHSDDVQPGPRNPLDDWGMLLWKIYVSVLMAKGGKNVFLLTILSYSQGDKENVLTHWTMDPRQAKMCLSQCVDNSLIPGELNVHDYKFLINFFWDHNEYSYLSLSSALHTMIIQWCISETLKNMEMEIKQQCNLGIDKQVLLLSLSHRCEEDVGGGQSHIHTRHWGTFNSVTIISLICWHILITIKFVLLFLLLLSGCSESLGPAFPRHDPLLAWFCHPWLSAHGRMRPCLHGCVSKNIPYRLAVNMHWGSFKHCLKSKPVLSYRQEKGSMKMITLTKKDTSQVTMIALSEATILRIILSPVFNFLCSFNIFQISSLQVRFLPSMTVCYSLDVSSVSCLVQTSISMVNNQI